MARILVVGPDGPLTRERSLVGQHAGHQIFWFSSPKVNRSDIKTFGQPTWTGRFGRILLSPISLWSVIHRIRPDLIHVHYAIQGSRTLSLIRYHPLVMTVMGGDILPEQGYHGFNSYLVRTLLDRADCITSKSEFLDVALARIGDYRTKIRRVTWGVDLNRFRPDRDVAHLRTQWHIPPEDLVFFDVRLALSLYNKHIILAAFANYLSAGGPPATLLVAELSPDPAYAAQLRRLAYELSIAHRVRFVGTLASAVMPDYYALADVTLSIPSSDGLPQTAYEALASGSFLIMGDLPQYAGVVEDGVTARLVPPGDSQAVAEALIWIAARPEVRKRAVCRGRAYVEQHANQPAQINLMNQIYAELLTACKRR